MRCLSFQLQVGHSGAISQNSPNIMHDNIYMLGVLTQRPNVAIMRTHINNEQTHIRFGTRIIWWMRNITLDSIHIDIAWILYEARPSPQKVSGFSLRCVRKRDIVCAFWCMFVAYRFVRTYRQPAMCVSLVAACRYRHRWFVDTYTFHVPLPLSAFLVAGCVAAIVVYTGI